MFFHFLRSAAKVFALALVLSVIYSLIYNQPIRFRPKMDIYARSVHSPFSSSERPDQIILSPAEDSGSSVGLSWRTSTRVATGEVRYRETGDSGGQYMRQEADLEALEAREVRGDRLTHHFSATLKNLKPGVSYTYTVGDPSSDNWSLPRSFIMPIKEGAGFSFIHFGDTQTRPAFFGKLLADVNSRHPETAFYMISGDLTDDGDWRYMWDTFMSLTADIFSQKPVAPALGNHDYSQGKGYGLEYFQALFKLPGNGPEGQPGSYSFRHENVHFIVLDSNQDAAGQAGWLEEELKAAEAADFRVIMFHHPPYNIKNKERRKANVVRHWTPLFDTYKVDLVLNGHDHIYLRTKKIHNGQTVADDEEGVTYVVAVACERFHQQEESEYARKQLANTGTYQVIAVGYDEAGKASLNYKAYDFQHELVDEFSL